MKDINQMTQTIDGYINQFPKDIQMKLSALRYTIQQAAPEATETFSYRMPTFYLKGNLVHFAVFQKHIGFYPGSSGVEAFQSQLGAYHTSKGAIQFPINSEIPFDLVEEIVEFRVKENHQVYQRRLDSKKCK